MSTARRQLLIVEDEEAHVEAIRRAFEAAGTDWEIRAVDSLRECRAGVVERRPDLILMDLNLPDGRATEVLTAPPENAPFPVLVMTAFGNQQIVVEVLKAGALDYVVKSPESFATMPRTVESALREWLLLQKHKQAEEELWLSRQRLALHVQQTPLAVIEFDLEGRVREWNPAAAAMFGFSREEALGQSWKFMVPEPVWPQLDGVWENIVSQQGGGRSTNENRTKDGRVIICEWFNTPLVAANGQTIGVASLVMDITARKQAEAALRASEQEFRSLAEAIPQMVWATRADGWNIYFNQQWTDYTGLTAAESYGHGWNIPFHPDDRQRAQDAWQRATQQGTPYVLECRLRRADGTYRWWLIRGVPMRDASGKILKWFGTCTDIEDLKRAEGALRESEEMFRSLSRSSPLGIFMMDTAGHCVYTNPRYREIMGLSLVASQGEGWLGSIHPDDRERVAAEWSSLTRGGRDSLPECRVQTPAGTVRWIRMRAAPMLSEAGTPTGCVGTIEDITEHTRLEAEFLQAQKMQAIGLLAGGVAHDFNNLLTAIIGYGQLTLQHQDLPAQAHGWVEEGLHAAERAVVLTRQLLAFSRKQILAPKVFDLAALVAEMSKMLRRLIGETIELHLVVSPRPCFVKVDPGQIEQVVLNLCVNARDAMPHGGRLTIGTRVEETVGPDGAPRETVVLTVSDNGVGMTEEVKARIFEPFYTTKELGKGTGLGLSTCYGIMHQSGGEISVESELGRGATFKIELPYVAQTQAAPVAAAVEAVPRSRGETILVVEDEAAVRDLGVLVLEELGYKVLSAANGEEALRVAAQHAGQPLHLLLTDMVMPGLSGKLVAERILTFFPAVKVIYTSGYTDDEIVHQGILDPGVAFLAKPYAPSVLARSIREALDA